jgi:hypothetical protein
VTTPSPAPRGSHIYNGTAFARAAQQLRAHLTAQGVGIEIYYPLPLRTAVFRLSRAQTEDFRVVRASRETSLPICGTVEAQLQYVVDCIGAFSGLITSQIQRPADTIGPVSA